MDGRIDLSSVTYLVLVDGDHMLRFVQVQEVSVSFKYQLYILWFEYIRQIKCIGFAGYIGLYNIKSHNTPKYYIKLFVSIDNTTIAVKYKTWFEHPCPDYLASVLQYINLVFTPH
jgi:hypothetical protein